MDLRIEARQGHANKRVQRGSPFFAETTLEWAHGRCAWFALSAHRAYGWKLLGFFDQTGAIRHVACMTPIGILDAYGLGKEADVSEAFMAMGMAEPFAMRDASEAEICETFELHDEAEAIADAIHVVNRVLNHIGAEPS